MKSRLFKLSMLCLVVFMLSACGSGAGGDEEGIQTVETEPFEGAGTRTEEGAEESPESARPEEQKEEMPEAEADPWVGEYNDYDVNEPNLEIQKNKDGSYEIHIGVFRLLSINDGHGLLTEKGMEFTTKALTGDETTGVITLDGDIATVTFDPGWSGFDTIYSYQYYKTSNTPDMELFAY